MSLYHIGVIKSLLNLNLLPNIISGTSGGSLIGNFIKISLFLHFN